jgi:peptidyl-prolyl cis-trans isomerase C
MKKISAVLIGLALLVSGCKRAGDVLATFSDDKITRGEFYNWMEFRNMAKEAVLKNKSQQKSQLEQLVTEKLTVREAKKTGFEKDKDYQFLQNFFRQNFYAQYMSKTASTNNEYKENAVKIKVIKLLVKNYKIVNNRRQDLAGAELESAFAEKVEKAKSIIAELSKGASFDELAKKYSDDFSKRKGGDIGYIIDGMRNEVFTKPVFTLKKGEFTKEPIRDGNAVYIVLVDDIVAVTAAEIENVIKDKGQQPAIKRRLLYNSTNKLQENLLKGNDVVSYIDKVNFNNPAALVYKVGEKEFKVSDMDRLVDYIGKRKKRMGFQDKGATVEDKKKIAKDILQKEVLMREAIRRGFEKDEKFKKDLQFTLDYYLSGIYQSEAVVGNAAVTWKEVREYYTKNLEKMFTRNIKEGNKTVKQPVSFDSVRVSIEQRLLNMKRSEKIKAWVDDLLRKNNFKINESELEGK